MTIGKAVRFEKSLTNDERRTLERQIMTKYAEPRMDDEPFEHYAIIESLVTRGYLRWGCTMVDSKHIRLTLKATDEGKAFMKTW